MFFLNSSKKPPENKNRDADMGNAVEMNVQWERSE